MKNIKTILTALFFFAFLLIGYCSNNIEVKHSSWKVVLKTKDVGTAETFFEFEFSNDNQFVAYTRKNADKTVLGWTKSKLARIFTKNFKEGSLLYIQKGKIIPQNYGDSLKGIFTSSFGNFYFDALKTDNKIEGKLLNGKREVVGLFNAYSDNNHQPIRDYFALWEESLTHTRNYLYDKKLLQSREWKNFEKRMGKITPDIQDDVELLMAFYYYADKLPFSHYALFKPWEEWENYVTENPQRIEIKPLTNETVYLKITDFSGTIQEMNRVFDELQQKNYDNLIVDLRNNSGGSVEAGMTFAKRLVKTELLGGIFLTQKYFENHSKIPEVTEYKKFPQFSEANYDLIIQGISKNEGIVLKVIPDNPLNFKKIFLLVNNKTASTCEPIVYGFKQQKIATIIGQNTAGKMLNGEKFNLSDGFQLFIPTATYYTSDGKKLDQTGIKPDVFSEDPLQTALYLLHTE